MSDDALLHGDLFARLHDEELKAEIRKAVSNGQGGYRFFGELGTRPK
jgi:hypothetical protein